MISTEIRRMNFFSLLKVSGIFCRARRIVQFYLLPGIATFSILNFVSHSLSLSYLSHSQSAHSSEFHLWEWQWYCYCYILSSLSGEWICSFEMLLCVCYGWYVNWVKVKREIWTGKIVKNWLFINDILFHFTRHSEDDDRIKFSWSFETCVFERHFFNKIFREEFVWWIYDFIEK